MEILKRYLDKYLVVLWIRLTFGKKIIAPTESIIKYVRTIAIATGFPITRDARIKSVIVPISAPIMKGIAFLRVKSLEIAKGTRSPIVMLELKKRAVIPNPTKKAFFGLEKYFFKKFLVCSLPPKADIIDLEKTEIKLQEAQDFVKEIVSKGGTILFLGTNALGRNSELNANTVPPLTIRTCLNGPIPSK